MCYFFCLKLHSLALIIQKEQQNVKFQNKSTPTQVFLKTDNLSSWPLFYKKNKRSNKHARPVGGNKVYVNDTSNTREEYSEHA